MSSLEITPEAVGALKQYITATAEEVFKRLESTSAQTAHQPDTEFLTFFSAVRPGACAHPSGWHAKCICHGRSSWILEATDEHLSYQCNAEGPGHKLIVRLSKDLHDGFSLDKAAAMLVWDTHLQGLTASDSSIRAQPGLLLCDTHQKAANVVAVVAATSTLMDSSTQADVAFQLKQRVEQLKGSQPQRNSWVFAVVGNTSVELWQINRSVHCTYLSMNRKAILA